MKENIFLLFFTLLSTSYIYLPSVLSSTADPSPAPWPIQFHSILFTNGSDGSLSVTDLWYDFPNGRNFNIVQNQLGKKTYSLEWTNGTSFVYTLDESKECETKLFPVGVLRPNWLDGAEYLGQVYRDGFLCNKWWKIELWYYEDVVTKRPVGWDGTSGARNHFITFEVGKVLDDPNWQAPVYCFEEDNKQENKNLLESSTIDHGSLMRSQGQNIIPVVI